MPVSNQTWCWEREHVIPSDSRQGRYVLEEVLHELESRHWSRHEIFCIHLAVHEAIINAIEHGNGGDLQKKVHIRSQISPRSFRMEILDEGPGFDPRTIPDATDTAHLDRPGGRGVLLMRSFMTRVKFFPPGNRVVLEKDRS